MRGSRGGGSGPPPPPLEFAKLNFADITGNEKISFHICDGFFSYLRLDPPGKIFWIRSCISMAKRSGSVVCSMVMYTPF